MGNKSRKNNKRKLRRSPVFLIALFNFLIIILIAIYFIYLRFVPYKTITYDGYAVSGKDLVNNLLNPSFDVDQSIEALEVKDQDEIYKNYKSYYVGAAKERNINLDYPIYVNDKLALYNLSKDMKLITSDLKTVDGYEGFTITSGALYDEHTMERADYNDYILMKNSDNMYINTKEMKIETSSKKYTIKMNSVINFTKGFITYYTLEDGKFVYGKILDIDEASIIKINDFNCKYTYKELMIALGIMKEEIKTPEENTVEENKVEENETEENKINEQKPNINKKPDNSKKPDDRDNNGGNTIKWQKPKVSCTKFIANIYSASTEVTIDDPSGAISKAVTFNFYKDDELSFRASTNISETLKVIKLLPNTKYTVIGTYQYTDESGEIYEVKFTTQEFKTAEADKVNPIELSLKNGKIYSDKIELQNLKIISDIEDEAINGVTKARININGDKYSINTQTLLDILQGKDVKYQTGNVLKSNTKYKYEIIFYDTANNEMKLKGNTGNTVTLKAAPTVNLRLKESDMVSNKISVQLVNEDDVNILDYRYELYDGTGKQIEKKNIDTSTKELLFNTLDPNKPYELKVKGNYDIEDGNGIQKNQEIGYLKFTTSPLGKLFVDIQCDEQDITDSTAKVKISVNDNTNSLLFQILQNIKIQIQRDDTKQIIEEVNLTGNEINEFAVEGLEKVLNNLNSNTTYNVVVTAIAKQGSVTEEVAVELKGEKIFTTRKKPAEFITKEVLITNNMIELVANLTDIDGACLNGTAELRLKEAYDEQADDGKIINTNKMNISVNTDVLCTYKDLKEGRKYILECYIDEYNETNDENKVAKKYFKVEYITGGLSGKLSLKGITREKTENGKNLIDVESENKWYSQCFGVLEKGYKVVDGNTVFDDIKSTRNYGKTASVGTNTSTLTLTSNQCYVYDFSKYKGKNVTMSFKAKVSSDSIKDNIYIQKGKSIGTSIEKIEGVTTVLGDRITYTAKIPDDGYLGFYLSANSKETLEINDLQVELGNKATDYEPFTYNVKVQAKANFEDKDFQTNEEEKEIGYFYVRLKKNGIIQKKNENGEYEDYIGNDYLGEKYGTDTYGDGDNTKAAVDLSYILNAETSAVYKLEIVIAKYGREHILDELEFKYDPINCSEIKVIDNKKEFLDIQPKGNYFISKNIDLIEATKESQYTFGSPEIQFYGSIDFNGKTISKDMKNSDIENNQKYTPYLFYQIAENASLKNLVYDYYIKNTNERANYINELDGIYGLFLYNNGTIDNLMFHLQKCTKNDKKYIGLVGYENRGVINKFIIKFDSKLYGSQYINGFCTKSYGTIQNGYIYGQGIETRGSITEFGSRNISGMIGTLMAGGSLRNVYNVSPIIINHITNTDSIAANMIYTAETGSNIRNIYSTQEIKVNEGSTMHKKSLDQNQKEVNKGPNIYNSSGANSQFSYYFCSTTYENNDYNMKQSYTALNDYKFQNNLLNTDEAFEIEQYVENHYFPQLKLNKCMPYQETINIEEKNEVVLNIISTEKIEYKDIDNDKDIKDEPNIIDNIKRNVKTEIEGMNNHDGKEYEFTDNFDFDENNIQIIKLSVYNPNGYGFEEEGIQLKFVDSKVIGLKRSEMMSILYLLLSNPTSYIDEYEIYSITGEEQGGEKINIQYGEGAELGKKTVKVSFTKHIYTTEEWHNIGVNDQNGVSGLIQNYKLYENLNFEGKCNSNTDSPYIMGTFKGTLDGQNYTLSNISDSQKSLFEQVAAGTKLENIKIENYKQSNSAIAGVLGIVGSSNSNKQTLINNIHINDIDLSGNNQYIGGLCGYMYTYNTYVQNCSVNSLTIKNLKNDGNYYIGGIIGYAKDEYGSTVNYSNTKTYINNSYATNIDIDATDIQNSKTATIGGILGICTYSYSNKTNQKEIQYCYAQGKVLSKSPYIGGICGEGTTTININNCYSLVDIETKQESGRTYIGGIIGKDAKTLSNNLYLGNIVAKNVSSYTNRIAGSGTQGANNYGYEKQLVNGNVSDTLYGAKGLLKYGEIFVKDTWISKLNMGDDKKYYNYKDLDSKWLPKICNTNGNILNEGNQPNIIFGEVMKASLVSVAYSDKNETKVKITLSVDNVENVREDSLRVEIENMETETISLDKEKKIIEIIARPTKFYDSYVLKTITYSQDDSDTSTTLEVNFIISKSFYNTINSVSEWNDKITNDGENYKITDNLIFKDNDGNSLLTNYNKKIGRIISSDGHKRIEGIELSLDNANSGFINQIVKELKNIDFNNCNITAKGNNGGLIYLNNGTINNCNFNNITINGQNKDYIGIVARCSNFASMSSVNLSQIDVMGRSYVGGLCGYIPISSVGGTLNTINANTQENNNISITATGSYVGGIVGYSGIEMNNMTLKSVNITGRDYTGGCAGRLDRTGNNVTVTNSTIQGSSRATGACFGAKYYGYCKNIKSTNNEIYANQQIVSISSAQGVGGCVGFLYVNGSEGTIDSTDNKIYASGSNYVGGNMGVLWSYSWIIVRNITSTRNEVNGDSFVGGIIGEARHYYNNDGVGIIEKAYSTDNTINASGDNVGGCIGSSQLRMRNMKTIYTEKSNKPKINGKNCVGGITGKATYNCVSDSVSYYTINGAKVENANILGTGGYVGGISGKQMGTIYAAAVSNTTVNTTGNFAGGITGYYTASDKKNASYVASEKIYILHSFCSNSEINAASYAGGIVGKMVYGNVRYCYVGNTNVLASSNNAGGIVGYIENNKMTDKQYKAIIRYNYIVNTDENKMVMSNNIAGGIIGNIDLSYISREDVNDYNLIENYIANNLALTDINGIQVSMIIGFQSGKTEYTDEIKNTYVYKYSKVNGQYVKDTTEGKKGIYQLVSSNELNDTTSTSIYVDTNKLSLGTTRFNYTTGIFPQLKTMSDNYWNASNLNVIQPSIQVPEDPEDPDDTSTTSLLSNEMVRAMMLSNTNLELPELYTYAVDVDKINIEFSDINANMKFDIKTNEGKIVLESTSVDRKVYTLNYDFSTPLIVTVSNGTKWFTKEINQGDVQNLIQIIDNEYFYILENKLYSNKREFEGEYLNIYNGKGLTSSGKIYNILDMSLLGNLKKKIKVLNEEIPINETEYEGTNIKTFYHCSKISENNEEIYKDKQIFIKNGMMYLVDGSLDSKGNSIIIDSYNENRYETILGTDGVIYDLLTKVKYPTNFKNKDIIAMNNNIDNNDEIMLVYYSNGRVYAFNYITGEEVFDNNIGKDDVSLVSYIIDNLDVTKTLYKTDKSSYAEAKELTSKLEAMPIESAVTEIKEGRKKNAKISKNKKGTNTKYVTAYNADTQTYSVYSAKEILGKETSKVISENDKINKDTDLVEYYENISTGTVKLKGIGITVFVITLTSICVILIVMNKKSRKLNK